MSQRERPDSGQSGCTHPVAPPEQPAIVDDVTQTATVPADATEPPVEDVPEVKETTAPEAASSEIITEAKKRMPRGNPHLVRCCALKFQTDTTNRDGRDKS